MWNSWCLVLQQVCVLSTGLHGWPLQTWTCSRTGEKQELVREVAQLRCLNRSSSVCRHLCVQVRAEGCCTILYSSSGMIQMLLSPCPCCRPTWTLQCWHFPPTAFFAFRPWSCILAVPFLFGNNPAKPQYPLLQRKQHSRWKRCEKWCRNCPYCFPMKMEFVGLSCAVV